MNKPPFKNSHNGQLSSQDFDKAAKSTRMKAKTIELARKVLVEGISPNEVSKTYDVTVQWVNSSCDRILSASNLDLLTVSFQVPSEIRNEVTKIVDSCVKIYQASEQVGKK